MTIRCQSIVLVGLATILAAPAAGQTIATASGRTISAPLLQDAPRIDGRLDEPAWQRAVLLTGFTQLEPRAGEPASELTEVRVYYTERALHIGAELGDRNPSRIVASEYARDADLESNDRFEIFLDTFHDRRNAFYFATNAVGAERDALVRNEGELLNWEWDGVWYVASARHAKGWTAEITIPFSTLRFRSHGTDAWGINFGRLIARTREETFWVPLDRNWGFNARWRVSAYGELDGIRNVRPGGRLPLKPYLLAGAEHDFEDEPAAAGLVKKVGLDAKVGLTSTLVADLTLNTDFAQVESDQQQVNLTRFALFFPEKREFFLENSGLFQFGEKYQAPFEPPSTLLFFSRRIGLSEDGDPVLLAGGARVTGKLGRYDIGVLDIVSKDTRIDPETRIPAANFGAFRLKRDVLARSSVGAIFLTKSPADEGSSNQVAGADARLNLDHNVSVGGFLAQSFTPGLTGSAHLLGIDGGINSERLTLQGAYTDIGDDFNSEMGFIQRTGVRKYRGSLFIGRRPGMLGIRRFYFGNDHTYITDRRGRLQTQTNGLGPAIIFHDGSFMFLGWMNQAEGLTEPFEIREGVEVPLAHYRFNQAFVRYETDRSRRVSGVIGAVDGGFFGGTLHAWELSGRVRPRDRLMLELQYFRNRVDLPIPGGRFATNLLVGRTSFAFSTRAFLRALVQMNDDDREARVNVLFRYTYRPGADLFVVYNEDRGINGERPKIKRRQFLVKLTVYVVPR